MGIFTPGVSKIAYQGRLTCPFVNVVDGKACESTALRYIEDVTPFRLRYRCRKCGGTFQYDISARTDINPYAAYQKGKIWGSIMRASRGRKLKGAYK